MIRLLFLSMVSSWSNLSGYLLCLSIIWLCACPWSDFRESGQAMLCLSMMVFSIWSIRIFVVPVHHSLCLSMIRFVLLRRWHPEQQEGPGTNPRAFLINNWLIKEFVVPVHDQFPLCRYNQIYLINKGIVCACPWSVVLCKHLINRDIRCACPWSVGPEFAVPVHDQIGPFR